MRCRRCGGELAEDGRCAVCGMTEEEWLLSGTASGEAHEAEEEPRIHVLTDLERNAYRGITIEEGAPERPDVRFEKSRRGWGGMIYTSGADSWQSKLMLYAGGALLLMFVFFVALPVTAAILVLGALAWFLFRLFT